MLAWSSVFFCVCLNRRRQENKGILSVPWFRTSRPAFWRWWVSAFTADNKLASNIYLFFSVSFYKSKLLNVFVTLVRSRFEEPWVVLKYADAFALGSPDALPDAAGLPYTSFDHSKAHFYRYDEQVSLCLERLKSESFAVFAYLSDILITFHKTQHLTTVVFFSVHLWLGKIRPNLLSR